MSVFYACQSVSATGHHCELERGHPGPHRAFSDDEEVIW